MIISTCILVFKAKRQYLLTLQVSRYCLLALQCSINWRVRVGGIGTSSTSTHQILKRCDTWVIIYVKQCHRASKCRTPVRGTAILFSRKLSADTWHLSRTQSSKLWDIQLMAARCWPESRHWLNVSWLSVTWWRGYCHPVQLKTGLVLSPLFKLRNWVYFSLSGSDSVQLPFTMSVYTHNATTHHFRTHYAILSDSFCWLTLMFGLRQPITSNITQECGLGIRLSKDETLVRPSRLWFHAQSTASTRATHGQFNTFGTIIM